MIEGDWFYRRIIWLLWGGMVGLFGFIIIGEWRSWGKWTEGSRRCWVARCGDLAGGVCRGRIGLWRWAVGSGYRNIGMEALNLDLLSDFLLGGKFNSKISVTDTKNFLCFLSSNPTLASPRLHCFSKKPQNNYKLNPQHDTQAFL